MDATNHVYFNTSSCIRTTCFSRQFHQRYQETGPCTIVRQEYTFWARTKFFFIHCIYRANT